jgi:putative PIN family toxin of toxin-antitoxin system
MPRAPSDAPAMRIVVDTNTVVSGLLWPGPPRRLIDLARARKYTPCTSVALLAELAEVIGRKKFAQRLQAAGLSPAALVQDYARLCAIVEPATLPQPVCRDPDDDLVLATALTAQAFLIVSGDLDLLDLGAFRDIRIVNAADALRTLSA